MSYDRAITVFSPDGHLMQVEYAMETVKKGGCVVGVKGVDSVVLAAERKMTTKLQISKSAKKIFQLDGRLATAFAGLNADARVLINKTRLECQRYRMNTNQPASVGYISKFIARLQQKYTHRGGVRLFGVALLLIGYDADGKPGLFQTDPSGIHSSWKAQSIGRSSTSAQEFLEKNYTEDLDAKQTVTLSIKALAEVMEVSANNIEVAVLSPDGLRILDEQEIKDLLQRIEEEKEPK
ncbi:proteasome A-type and B-type family protein, putative [Babesia bigemina]|uniref:Proteasome A-type and B-type family protein, putative n=1 Tax=Babesia bigemina TaxID=5866 RepID=A0A061D9M6_BABBI|nr:proteasome A-type and B-type family protein, putative [Babesia bigemina]CDR97381.1 proteasome A-type and B-type family protein, putative [Babesia bigemina]|eukprot:XP_012769567.1 proteasome A-type and B-type family protein, putative [Babesia bigemina]